MTYFLFLLHVQGVEDLQMLVQMLNGASLSENDGAGGDLMERSACETLGSSMYHFASQNLAFLIPQRMQIDWRHGKHCSLGLGYVAGILTQS